MLEEEIKKLFTLTIMLAFVVFAGSAAAEVLVEQAPSTINTNTFANQDFEAAYDTLDIFSATAVSTWGIAEQDMAFTLSRTVGTGDDDDDDDDDDNDDDGCCG